MRRASTRLSIARLLAFQSLQCLRTERRIETEEEEIKIFLNVGKAQPRFDSEAASVSGRHR